MTRDFLLPFRPCGTGYSARLAESKELMISQNNLVARWLWQRYSRRLKKAALDKHHFNLAWGRAREIFYQKWGPFRSSRAEAKRLETLRNQYQDQRLFIIGNGPSLNRMPLDNLSAEWTFGVNRIYLLFNRINWRPSFYTITDWRVAPDIAEEINALSGMTFFFPERFRELLRTGEDVFWYWKQCGRSPDPGSSIAKRFAFDIHTGVRSGGSVLVTAIQIAYHLGFNPIYLIGVDMEYQVPKSVKQSGPSVDGIGLYLTSTKDDDSNHFDPTYFGKNRRWRAPDIPEMEKGFENCRAAFASTKRIIYNATVGGNLEVFERVEFNALFGS